MGETERSKYRHQPFDDVLVIPGKRIIWKSRDRIPPLVRDLAYINTYITTRSHTNTFGPIIVLQYLTFTKPYQREDKKMGPNIFSVREIE